MLELVRAYTRARPGNPLARFLPALRRVNGTSSHVGWDGGSSPPGGVPAKTRAFRRAQDRERDRVYFGPAVSLAKSDGVRALGQFAYYDRP